MHRVYALVLVSGLGVFNAQLYSAAPKKKAAKELTREEIFKKDQDLAKSYQESCVGGSCEHAYPTFRLQLFLSLNPTQQKQLFEDREKNKKAAALAAKK